MSKGPLLALGIVLALAAVLGALVFLGGGGPRGVGDDAGPETGAGEAAPRAAGGAPVTMPEGAADPGGLAVVEAAKGTGAVRVRILDGTTRLAVEGVHVSLAGRSAARARVSTSVRTASDGEALLEGVPAGEAYALRATPPGARPIERHDVAVVEGKTTDLGILFTGARGVVEGVVVDDDGRPVAGASVSATLDPKRLTEERSAFPRAPPFPSPAAADTTDEAGAFRLEGLPTGLVALQANKERLRTATDLVLLERADTPVLRRLVLTRATVLRGSVVHGAGLGIANAEVAVVEKDGGTVADATTTDGDGRFELPGYFGEGLVFDLVVTAQDRVPVVFSGRWNVAEPLRLTLDGGATLEVTVIDSHTDLPLVGARVQHVRSHGGGPRLEPHSNVSARTDAEGRVVLDLRPGPNVLVRPYASHEGFRHAVLRTGPDGRVVGDGCRFEGDATRPLSFGDRRSIRMYLRRPTTVFGRVTDAADAPVVAVGVSAAVGAKVQSVATTDGLGAYRLEDVKAPTGGQLLVDLGDGQPFAHPLPAITGEEVGVRVDVRLPPGRAAVRAPARDVDVSAGARVASVRGRVLTIEGEPVPGARIVTGRRSVVTDVTGQYHLPEATVREARRPVDPSYVEVVVTADGFLGGASLQVPANPGDEVRAKDAVLGVGLTVSGLVVGPHGKPVPHARVAIPETGGREGRTTAADEGGRFSFQGLTTSQPRVIATADLLLGVSTLEARSVPGRNVITLRRVVDARGRVRFADGRPVEGARTEIVFAGGASDVLAPERERTLATTGPGGEFRLYTSAANPVRIRVLSPGSHAREVSLPTSTEPFDVVLER